MTKGYGGEDSQHKPLDSRCMYIHTCRYIPPIHVHTNHRTKNPLKTQVAATILEDTKVKSHKHSLP